MPTARDISMSETSRFGTVQWAATRLGLSVTQFRARMQKLSVAGFPERDPITDRYIKDDVDAWIDQRCKIARPVNLPKQNQQGANYDAI